MNDSKLFSRVLAFIIFLLYPYLIYASQSEEGFITHPIKVTTTQKNYKHLTVNDGFGRSAIMDITQTKNGMMWFATWDGVYTYDGYKLKLICQPVYQANGEPEVISSIIEAPEYKIWLRNPSQIFIWDVAHQTLEKFNPKTEDNDSITGVIQCITKDLEDNVWICCNKNQVFQYKTKEDVLINETAELDKNTKFVHSLYVDKENKIWACTNDRGIYQIVPSTAGKRGKVVRNKFFDLFNSSTVHCLFQDAQKNYWVATPVGTFRISSNNAQSEDAIVKYEIPENLKGQNIRFFNFAEGLDGICASSNNGLFHYKKSTSEVSWIMPDLKNDKGLNDKNIRKALIDQEGGLWLATFNGGVNYLSLTSENFSVYNYLNHQLHGHVISDIAKDNDENLWIGTDDGGFSFWNRKTNEVKNYFKGGDQTLAPTNNNVQSIYVDNDMLYVGMFDGGMDAINLKTHQKTNYNKTNTKPDRLSNIVYGFHKISAGRMLVATQQGLYLYNIPTHEFHKMNGSREIIHNIIQDQDQDIWVSTDRGLRHYSQDLVLKHHFFHNPKDSTSLVSDNITTIASFGSTLYLGTNAKGLWTYQKDEGKFRYIPEPILNNVVIYNIIIDKDNLWISTNKGLFNYNTNTRQIKNYTSKDGLCYNQFKMNSGVLTTDHHLFFGTVHGITGFKPKELVSNNQRPRVIISDFYLFNKPIDIQDKNCPIKVFPDCSSKLELHQSHNNFTFKFASTSYSRSGINMYEYKLVPFEETWQKTTDGSSSAYYTNLPAGKYTLHVRTSNGNSLWSDERCIDITIHPYWWLSLPMKITYAVLLFGCVTFLISLYSRKKKKEIYLLQLKKEQEIYHSKMEFFTFMIHEIRTPLTLILGPLTDIMERKKTIEESMTELHTIKRNGNRLLALVNQLMDFRKVEEKSYMIQLGTIDLKEQIEQIAQNFQYNCKQKNIHLILNLPDSSCMATADREAVNKIVTNLLSNAVKFTDNRIDITLKLSDNEKMWEMTVKDNGKGIDKGNQTKIFNSFYQIRQDLPNDYIGTGVGLSVVKHLLELQGGNITVESCMGAGAAFTASIPTAEITDLENSGDEVVEASTKEDAQESSQKRRILIVEDNEEMRAYIKSIFSEQYIVDDCTNGKEALILTSRHGYDLILTDWMMPVMDGLTLSKTLKRQDETSHIPIIILTAKDDESSQVEGFTAHADAYVVKPFSSKVLLSQVDSIITNREDLYREYLQTPDTTEDLLCQNDVDKKFLENLNALIDERIMNTSISVDELATHLYMGRTTFYQKVKGVVGITPNEYVSTYKLKKAAQILKTGNVRISEICYMVGFSSSSYFAKKFTAQFGMSPSEYLKQQKIK